MKHKRWMPVCSHGRSGFARKGDMKLRHMSNVPLLVMTVIVGITMLSVLPAFAEEAAGALPVNFTLTHRGRVSVNIYRKDGALVYQLAVGQSMSAGPQQLHWDGCDNAGQPVPVGEYEVRGLCSTVHSVWDGKVANSSPAAGSEWLQYRTGLFTGVVSLPDGGLVTLSGSGEHGRVIQCIGGAPKYAVRWTSILSSPVVAAAVDGAFLYVVSTHDVTDPQTGKKLMREGLARICMATGLFEPFADGVTSPSSAAGQHWLGQAHPPFDMRDIYQPTGKTLPFGEADVLGLAARNGKLYVPHHAGNNIAVLDAQSGKELATIRCPAPRKITLDAVGRLYVTSGEQSLRLNADGSGQAVLATGFSYAGGVALAPQGLIYVTDLGESQQVKVFRADGKLLRTFGRKAAFNREKWRSICCKVRMKCRWPPMGQSPSSMREATGSWC